MELRSISGKILDVRQLPGRLRHRRIPSWATSVNTTDDEQSSRTAADKLKASKSPWCSSTSWTRSFDLHGERRGLDRPLLRRRLPDHGGRKRRPGASITRSQGFNLFIDAMCIPTCCQNKEAAETFINFLCKPGNLPAAIMDYLGYATPETAAKEHDRRW